MGFSSDQVRYLDLLKQVITGSLFVESSWLPIVQPKSSLKAAVIRFLGRRNFIMLKVTPFNTAKREGGEDWPLIGYSMAGHKRIDNVRDLIASVVDENVEGDFVECGVWRGGSSMYAKAALNLLGSDKHVWLCDSFEGMPVQKDVDKVDPALAGHPILIADLPSVKGNFERFGLLDDKVHFVKGWFSESLPTAPIEKISILRLDGDYYSSTMDALQALYDKVSPGGYVIVDDYNAFAGCKAAIHDFFAEKGINPELVTIDRIAVYWRVA